MQNRQKTLHNTNTCQGSHSVSGHRKVPIYNSTQIKEEKRSMKHEEKSFHFSIVFTSHIHT
jgi:hypothetical protein